jgi:beta-glucosidase
MKKKLIYIYSLVTLAGNVLFAQEAIQYQLCDADFRPIYMRENLPPNSIYSDTSYTSEERARDLVNRLTFDEKLELTGGWKNMHFPGVDRLGVPPVYFSDASQGIHIKDYCVNVEKSTAFPTSIALAATWNVDLAFQYAQSVSEECRAWGISVLLGPGLNMYRNSEGGRNYEYYGEDPYLSSRLAVNYVKGMQSLGTIATLKHFIGNEQEFVRHILNVNIGERALHEIYLAPFKAALEEGGALAVMTGNNFVNDYPGAANTPLSQGVLRDAYNFQGIVMSDWASTQFWNSQLDKELTSGHSLLMAKNDDFKAFILKEIKENPEKKENIGKELGTMVYHNLYSFFKAGTYDRPYRDPTLVNKIEDHQQVALKTAEEAITLLKNEDDILPLKKSVSKILVLGTEEALNVYTGKGSGKVEGYNILNYLEGLKNKFGDKIIRKTDATSQDIKSADVVILIINKPAGESFDIAFDYLDVNQQIKEISENNKNLIVVYSGGNGLPMPWLENVKGLLFTYLLGQEAGNALANVVSGDVNPSGKLPFTIEINKNDGPAVDFNKLPDGTYYWGGGKGDSRKIYKQFGYLDMDYDEGIFIGYRWYDKKQIKPRFPFGFGLSYTKFEYGNLQLSQVNIDENTPIEVSFELQNIGKLDGAEVVQLYVKSQNSSVEMPEKELKGFKKIFLKVGEKKMVHLKVNLKDLAYWDISTHSWQVAKGNYKILIGNSSENIHREVSIQY